MTELPLAEIWVLLEVGGVIGALPTVALVVLTAVVGAGRSRVLGLVTLARARAAADRGEVPAMELPPERAAGIKVESVDELMEKLQNEAKVL